jgi:hypothetical protein
MVKEADNTCRRKGQAMSSEAQRSVVILYEHALLGEGIARHVLAQSGVEATVARAHDLEAVTAALAFDPAVVIFELSTPLQQGDLATLAPHAVLIDVSAAVGRGWTVSPPAAGLERILEAVRGVTSTVSPPA